MLGNSKFKSFLILIVGIAIGALSMWGYSSAQGIKSYIVEGYSSGTNYNGTAIGVSQEVGGGGNSYGIAGVMWREFGGPWHQDGSPPSLAWSSDGRPSYGQKIRLGVIDYKPTEYAGGSSVVVWLEVIDVKNMVKE